MNILDENFIYQNKVWLQMKTDNIHPEYIGYGQQLYALVKDVDSRELVDVLKDLSSLLKKHSDGQLNDLVKSPGDSLAKKVFDSFMDLPTSGATAAYAIVAFLEVLKREGRINYELPFKYLETMNSICNPLRGVKISFNSSQTEVLR